MRDAEKCLNYLNFEVEGSFQPEGWTFLDGGGANRYTNFGVAGSFCDFSDGNSFSDNVRNDGILSWGCFFHVMIHDVHKNSAARVRI